MSDQLTTHTAQVTSLLAARHKSPQEVKVVMALFGAGEWKDYGGANSNRKSHIVQPYQLGMTFDQFALEAKRVFHRLGAKEYDVDVRRTSGEFAQILLKPEFYEAHKTEMVEIFLAACNQTLIERKR